MNSGGKYKPGVCTVMLLILLGLLAASVVWFVLLPGSVPVEQERAVAEPAAAGAVDLQAFRPEADRTGHPASAAERSALFSSELRVVAIGSAYPIPYAAEVCPFTQIPQPSMNQLDRDGDGLTDDWEVKYGLDKYNAADAQGDSDGDGFIEIEEFSAGTDPTDQASHPAYALKLRFIKRNEMAFPLIFQGVSEFSDGRRIFQLNSAKDGNSHFMVLGESVDGIVLQRFLPADEELPDRLVVVRESVEIILPKGRSVADPESHAELINILDRTRKIVTMGALLSLRNDEYTVLGVYADKVVIKELRSGKVYDVVGLTAEERTLLF